MIIEQHDWDKGRPIRLEVDDKLVEQFLNWMLNTSRWREDPEYFQKKFRSLKADLLATAHPGADVSIVPPAPKPQPSVLKKKPNARG